MPPLKRRFKNQVARLNGGLASPKKAIKRVAAIALSPVKSRPQKKHRNDDHDVRMIPLACALRLMSLPKSMISVQEAAPGAADNLHDVFLDAEYPEYQTAFHQGSTPESPTAAPIAFQLKGKFPPAENTGASIHRDDDNTSTHTFPAPRATSILAESDDDIDDLDDEIVPPEFDELCASDAGTFSGDGYPRPAPPKTFVQKMAALGTKQALAAAPDITSAGAALTDIELFLRGRSRGKSGGFIPPDLSPWVRVRMEGIHSHLALYTNPNSVTYGKWGLSARTAAIAAGRDVYCARRFANLSREYIMSRKVLPINPYGTWKKSMLADKDLANDIREHLQELGKFITADKLVNYLSRPDVMDKHGLDKGISVRTARRYLNDLGYRFTAEKKGQYCDGHEREDVVYYRAEIYLPTLKGFQDHSCIFDADGSVTTPSLPPGARRTSWYHKDAPATPYRKGDGASYMVADYFSADFGWLRTRDGRPIA
ncbi:hypothetical protein B0H16DRAFT_1732494 [Mycena metata]|uniref:Uncharacterized protein n=1 Tax=Mycena metata TaxID=1033252 RepID=A0AAD7I348_9AGAR|nr:hypothetical protein B0H16DRAFT_1732494 [Mycena metata]